MSEGLLILEDGEVFEGIRFGADVDAFGEVVFNTGLSGYQEVLTDPSYRGQMVAMTYPHIGNYGVNEQDPESSGIQVSGFITRDLPEVWSSWRGTRSLQDYLAQAGVAGITEVDTRRLTRHIRSKGAMRGAIASEAGPAVLDAIRRQRSMAGADLAGEVSATEPYEVPAEGERLFSVAALDFGIKTNILRRLTARGCAVTVFPGPTPAGEILACNPDGVFVSNGPGDPEAVGYGISSVSKILGRVPVFGICLGHQLMALAAGLPTYKLAFGHRGSNHPVARLRDQAIQITTQNHGFAVAEAPFGYEAPAGPGASLPAGAAAQTRFGKAEVTHLNLNDYTVEGFRLADQRAFCVQYHPEAGPGPHDSEYLFDEFCGLMSDA